MRGHSLRAFLRADEFGDWLPDFADRHGLLLFARGRTSARATNTHESLADPGSLPLFRLVSRAAAEGAADPSDDPEWLQVLAPVETSSILDPERRRFVEDAVCGTTGACLIMLQLSTPKLARGALFDHVKKELRRRAPLCVSYASTTHDGWRRDPSVRASIGALEWQRAGGALRQSGVKNVRYRVDEG